MFNENFRTSIVTIGCKVYLIGKDENGFGVIYILAKAIARVLPIAMEPFHAGSSLVLSPIQWR